MRQVVEAEFVAELQQRLKPEQFTRLQQIHWQRWGIIAIEDPELARQLELSPEQQEQLATVRRQIKTRRSELTQQRIEAPKQGGDLDTLLTPTQLTRLRQIDWQRQGIEGLSHPEVVKTLKINPQQQAELAALNREIFKTVRGLLNPAGKERPVSNTVDEILRRKVQEMVCEKEAKVQQILTRKQQQEWQEIRGPPFDLTLIRTRVVSPISPNPGQ